MGYTPAFFDEVLDLDVVAVRPDVGAVVVFGYSIEDIVDRTDEGDFAVGSGGRGEPDVVLGETGFAGVQIEDGFGVVVGEIGVLVQHKPDKLGRATRVDGIVGTL